MDNYIKIQLADIQKLFYLKMDFLHKFLKSNNIQYFSVAGTALGAFRDGKMIPWDDDIDLGMIRDEYEKFLKILPTLKDYFYIDHYSVSKKIEHSFVRLCFKETIRSDSNLKSGYNRNLHIDVFVLDFIPRKKIGQFFQKIETRSLRFINWKRTQIKASNLFKTILLRILQISFIPFSSRFIAKKIDKSAKRYSIKPQQMERVAIITGGVLSYEGEIQEISTLLPPKEVPFGPIKINIPNNCSLYLSKVYGSDFMIPKKTKIQKTNQEHGWFSEKLLKSLKEN